MKQFNRARSACTTSCKTPHFKAEKPLFLIRLPLLALGLSVASGGVFAAYPADAPWPVFRGDSKNSGHASVEVAYNGKKPWSHQTGKGIFSSPVVDGQEHIYIGSADRNFYVFNADGSIAWTFPTGEIIDSAAVITREGDATRVTVPSGDGFLYHLDASASIVNPQDRVLWAFDSSKHRHPTDIGYNWFEGNVVAGPDGTLYAGNTNWNYYALDPLTGALKFRYLTNNMNWSAGAFDNEGNIVWTSLDFHVRKYDPLAQQEQWKFLALGFISASVALGSDQRAYVGTFDNNFYALDVATGKRKWSFATTDHIYASAALGQDASGNTNAIYITSTDGNLYKLGTDGKLLWKYDVGDTVRSSPVVTRKPAGESGEIIYFGAADGRLYAINSDGSLRWAFDTNVDSPELKDRNDLNASPAVGRQGLYIAGEHGYVWHVPFDYPLHHPEDPRSVVQRSQPANLVDVRFSTPGGSAVARPDYQVPAASVIHGQLKVRKDGETLDASLNIRNAPGLHGNEVVTLTPAVPYRVERSADGHYFHVIPEGFLAPDTDYTVAVNGEYTWGGKRVGALEFAGTQKAPVSDSFHFHTAPVLQNQLPLHVDGQQATTVLMRRLAVPYPSMLTSLNQIGFDSLTWILTLVSKTEPDANGEGRFVMWATGAELNDKGEWQPQKGTDFVFPLSGRYKHDSFILENTGTPFDVSGIHMPMDVFELRGQWDENLRLREGATLYAEINALKDRTYGPLLALGGLLNSSLKLVAAGTVLTEAYNAGAVGQRPADIAVASVVYDQPTFWRSGSVKVNFSNGYIASQHLTKVMLVDRGSGKPVFLDYHSLVSEEVSAVGLLQSITLNLPKNTSIAKNTDAFVMTDAFPLYRADLAPSYKNIWVLLKEWLSKK